jgi:hypothetical protein
MTPEFGASAWGRAWLRLAEPDDITSIDTRLPKARSLARYGTAPPGTDDAGTPSDLSDLAAGPRVRRARRATQ